jgi:hypothetical protein
MAQRREYPDPGPRPENATPKELERWRRANELHAAEGFQKLPKERPKIDATDERLKELRREHVRFLDKINPATDALWLALLKRGQDVLADVDAFERLDRANRLGLKEVVYTPEIPAIVLIAERQVANAIRGDNAAIAAIADRIEGKPGLRSGDANPDDPDQIRKRREVVEDVVRAITDKRLRDKMANAEDARVTVVEPTKEPDGNTQAGSPVVWTQEPRQAEEVASGRVAE